MTLRKTITCLLLIGAIIAISAFKKSADDPINKIAQELDDWLISHPQEKVYLQLDKPYYAIGDDIWFKAYVTIGQHKLSALSSALYVDLINDRDSVKRSIKLPVVNGFAWGDFALPDTLAEGNYRIRAYTAYMRNAGEAYFFDKTITISNAISNNVFTKTNYSYSKVNGQQKVDAVIGFTNLNNDPYANSQVSYQVQLGSKIVAKGRGQTDDKGNLALSFLNTHADLIKSGRIITELKLADKKIVTSSILVKATSASVDVQFFPEGGSLVNTVDSKIAFKAVGADGLDAVIKGTITDNENKQVTSFSSEHLGMGAFMLKPESGKTYKAKISYPDGSEGSVDLPRATDSGYSLSAENADAANISISIKPGPVVQASNSDTEVINLIGQVGGVIYYAGKSRPGSKFFTATVPKSKFPSGIVQFTLFSSKGEPLNERLVFVQNNDQLKLSLAAEKTYAPRQKVKIDLMATDSGSKPVLGGFSMAVTDETNIHPAESEDNILSNLLLTSDLKGYIEKTGYYFDNPDAKKQDELDVLMLTQGYRRFEWKQLLSESYAPIHFQPERTMEITGHIKTLGGKPVRYGKVTLLSTSGTTYILDTVSDSEGRFSFKNLFFKDSMKFVIQARTAKDRKNVQIDLDTVGPQPAGKNKNFPDLQVNITDGLSPFLQNSKRFYTEQVKYGINNHSILLKEVQIREKKIKNKVENSSNLNGPGEADQVIKADEANLTGCARITDCLQGRLFGVVFHNGVPYSTRSPGRPMAVMIDGIYVDSNFLDDLNPADIATIEVLRSITYTAIYGAQGGGGVLVITSKTGNGDSGYQRYAPGIITYAPKGFYKAREFYSPQYDKPKTNTKIADLRSTIYWNPNIITGTDGKASVSYFNADAKGTYRIVIEGIDADGHIGRKVFRYQVQ